MIKYPKLKIIQIPDLPKLYFDHNYQQTTIIIIIDYQEYIEYNLVLNIFKLNFYFFNYIPIY